jgi:hypothetical protein
MVFKIYNADKERRIWVTLFTLANKSYTVKVKKALIQIYIKLLCNFFYFCSLPPGKWDCSSGPDTIDSGYRLLPTSSYHIHIKIKQEGEVVPRKTTKLSL